MNTGHKEARTIPDAGSTEERDVLPLIV